MIFHTFFDQEGSSRRKYLHYELVQTISKDNGGGCVGGIPKTITKTRSITITTIIIQYNNNNNNNNNDNNNNNNNKLACLK
jgi:hypothetical protein